MYKNEDAKRAYFKNRYKTHKDDYRVQRDTYWERYAKRILGKEEVTEQEVKDCKNAYYREYRKNNKEQTDATNKRFWENQAKKLEKESE